MNAYDVIVVGIGGMGSATLYELQKRGKHVLGIEQFGVPNDQGSSHGSTRIIRLAYYEHPSYVPIMQRGYKLWRDLENISNEKLLHITGSIDIGPENSLVFSGSKYSCELHNLPHEILNGDEISKLFPAFTLPKEIMSVFQPDGGFLEPEKCIQAFVKLACSLGAELHTGERVLEWSSTSSGSIKLKTNVREYETESLVLTTGAWTGKLASELSLKLKPERQLMGWFKTNNPKSFSPEKLPVFNLLVPEGRYYGFPEFDIPGFKIGLYHHLAEAVDPDCLDRSIITKADEMALRKCVSEYFPDANGAMIMGKVCMFTNSPDEHFIVDRLEEHPNVFVAAGFSGHGFKYCSVIGEILACLINELEIDLDIDMFKTSRFAK